MDKLFSQIWLTIKIVIGLCALRALVLFAGIKVEIPLLDPLFFALRDGLVGLGDIGLRFFSFMRAGR